MNTTRTGRECDLAGFHFVDHASAKMPTIRATQHWGPPHRFRESCRLSRRLPALRVCAGPFWTLFVSLFVLPCSSTRAQDSVWEKALANGFADRDSKPLIEFLESWHTQSKPVPQELLRRKPAVERAVYDLYKEFFTRGGKGFEASKYVIVQNVVEVVIVDSDLRDVFARSVDRESSARSLPTIGHFAFSAFRPPLALSGKKVLYLDDPQLSVMLGFLTGKDGDGLVGGYADEDSESPERRERLAYLNTALRILPGHWGKGWHFESHPFIRSAYFSSSLDRALVCFRLNYGGGEAIMEREGEGWRVVRMQETWVE